LPEKFKIEDDLYFQNNDRTEKYKPQDKRSFDEIEQQKTVLKY
jgi:hypothetical protein